VQQADIAASNGAIHALESVLPLPGSLAKALDAFPTLKSLVAAANLTLPYLSSSSSSYSCLASPLAVP
jgi:hypothetical protein